MLVDSISKYLNDIETLVRKLYSAYVERYEEEVITSDRANLRIRIRFRTGHMLELNEAIIDEGRQVEHLAYRYHFQDDNANLIFRYDNTPHFQHIESFPHHKHLPNEVIAVSQPSVLDVITEAEKVIV